MSGGWLSAERAGQAPAGGGSAVSVDWGGGRGTVCTGREDRPWRSSAANACRRRPHIPFPAPLEGEGMARRAAP